MITFKPCPHSIEQILTEMADPDFEYEPPRGGYWYVSAHDAAGNYQATGTGNSLEAAAAGAWINANLSDELLGSGPLPLARLLAEVPAAVPSGWTFEIDNFPVAGHA